MLKVVEFRYYDLVPERFSCSPDNKAVHYLMMSDTLDMRYVPCVFSLVFLPPRPQENLSRPYPRAILD